MLHPESKVKAMKIFHEHLSSIILLTRNIQIGHGLWTFILIFLFNIQLSPK